MKSFYLKGGDAEARAAVRVRLADIGPWASTEAEADGVVVLLRTRDDWAIWNASNRVVAGIAYDRRYAGGDGSEGAPVFAAEETERLRFHLENYFDYYAPLAATREAHEYDGCLW